MLLDKNKHESLENKLAKFDLDLVTMEEENKKSDEKIKILEAEIMALEKDNNMKNGIIKNLNVGFHEKIKLTP